MKEKITMENKNLIEEELQNVSGGYVNSDNYHLVQPGDTLGALAVKYHTTVDNLMRLNPRIKNANMIYAGEVLRIR
jgi:LysM repeat protein